MKITKEKLKQIIKEELEAAVEESYGSYGREKRRDQTRSKAQRKLNRVKGSPHNQYVRLMPDDIPVVLQVEVDDNGEAKVFAYSRTDHNKEESQKLGEVDVNRAYLPRGTGNSGYYTPAVYVPRAPTITRGQGE